MREQAMTIGELARRAACKVQTVRYYEQIGLMPEPARTKGQQRRYGTPHLDRLSFIRHSRELGFPLVAVRELLGLSDRPEQSCAAADRIARRQLKEVESRLVRLRALRAELKRMIEQCGGGRVAECRVIEALADHAHCKSEHHADPA